MDSFTSFTACSTPKKINHPKHPNTQTMVDEALRVSNRKCSYRAIKHFIATKYFVDMRFLLTRIKSYIRESLANGKFIQMTGHGLNGSFRMSAAAKKNPSKFLKKPIRRRRRKERKSITFQTTPMHRRTSLTKRIRLSRKFEENRRTGLTKLKDFGDENNNDLPSTSSETVYYLRSQYKLS